MMLERQQLVRMVRMGSALLLSFALMLVARPGAAHPIGLSRGDYQVTRQGVDVAITLGRTEALVLVPPLDSNHDDAVDDRELAGAHDNLVRQVVEPIRVTSATEACPGELLSAVLTDTDAVIIHARYSCAHPPATAVTVGILSDLARGHRHAVHATADSASKDELCFLDHPSFTLPAMAPSTSATSGRPALAAALRFTAMGFEHVLRGYDHLLFLFALLLIGGRVRSLLWTTTAFTLGHSLTLALATLGLVSLPSRLVECAIALSIAYVGVENIVSPRSDRRWRLTLVFGMVHGFGFASALAELGLSRAEIVPALVTFNVGVELAQLVAMAVFLPVVCWVRAREPLGRRLVPALSLLITLCGLVWFVERLSPSPRATKAASADDRVIGMAAIADKMANRLAIQSIHVSAQTPRAVGSPKVA